MIPFSALLLSDLDTSLPDTAYRKIEHLRRFYVGITSVADDTQPQAVPSVLQLIFLAEFTRSGDGTRHVMRDPKDILSRKE